MTGRWKALMVCHRRRASGRDRRATSPGHQIFVSRRRGTKTPGQPVRRKGL